MTDTGLGQSDPPPIGTPSAGDIGSDATALASDPSYPITAGLNYGLDIARWRVIGNYFMAIPHFVVLYVLQIVAEIFAVLAWFAILFTGEIPRGLADFIAGVQRYQWRVWSFAMFLREPYPPFTVPSGYADPGGDPAWLQIAPAQSYSRLAVFFRIVIAIPQMLLGFVFGIAAYACMIVAWFAVLITGRWPEGLRRFVVRVAFWWIRVNAWYYLLADPYPPFSLG